MEGRRCCLRCGLSRDSSRAAAEDRQLVFVFTLRIAWREYVLSGSIVALSEGLVCLPMQSAYDRLRQISVMKPLTDQRPKPIPRT